MPKHTKLTGHLKFLTKKPDTTRYNLSKEQAYNYLENLVLSKGPLGKTKDLLPEFVLHLGSLDEVFGKIPEGQIKTGHKFIECIYYDLKNAATKIKTQINKNELLPYEKTVTEKFSQSQAKDIQSVHEPSQIAVKEVVPQDDVISDDKDEKSSTAKNPSSADSESVKISSRSIKKLSSETYLKKLAKQYPKQWGEICMLRELVKAKQYEVKYAMFKLDKKMAKFHQFRKPGSPMNLNESSSALSESSN